MKKYNLPKNLTALMVIHKVKQKDLAKSIKKTQGSF